MTGTPQPLTGFRLVLGAMTLALANFIVVLDTTIANVSVPHIAGGLAVSSTQGTWAITSYAVADAIMVPLTGWLSARFGSVRWFVISLIGFAIFSFLCGIANSLSMLVTFRVLQGLSGGPLMPLSQTLLLRVFPKEKAGLGLGIWGMTTTCAPIFGPILGGYISDNWSWPWIFFINLPVVAVCIFGALRMISPFETKTDRQPIDIVGLVLLVVWVGAFQVMLDTGREHDWFQSSQIILLTVVAILGFGVFCIWELTDKHPVVNLRVLRHRGFTAASFAIMLGFGAYFAQVVLTPLWLQETVGYTATNSGLVVAWVGLFAVVCAPIAGQLLGKVDLRIAVSLGLLWLAAMTFFRARWTTDVDYWTLAWPHLLQGAGLPFFFIGLTSLALSSVPEEETVSAAGIMNFLRTLSGAIATAMATTSWDNASTRAQSELAGVMNDPAAAMATYEQAGAGHEAARRMLAQLVGGQSSTIGAAHVYLIAAVIFLVAVALVWFVPKPRRMASAAAAH